MLGDGDETRQTPIAYKRSFKLDLFSGPLSSDLVQVVPLRIWRCANEIDIDKVTVHSLNIENLAIRKIYAKLVPKVLTEHQKQR